jgi:hypothetical protein
VAANLRSARESILSPTCGCCGWRTGTRGSVFGEGRAPDLGDLLRAVDPVDVELCQREDFGGRAIGVRQDLSGLGRFTEEVASTFARAQARRQSAFAAGQLPDAEGRAGRRESQEDLRPDRKQRRSV